MTTLLVDSGNRSIKWAVLDQQGLSEHGRLERAGQLSLAEAWRQLTRPDRIVVSNVAGESDSETISTIASDVWQRQPEFVISTDACCGVTNDYQDPAQLGVDRWLAMIAAYDLASRAVIVVDCGTAVTIDLVDASGTFRGGVIMAGLGLSRMALRSGTAALTTYQPDRVTPIATTTGDAVISGTLIGLAGAIERIIAEQSGLLGTTPLIYLSGGDAEQLLLSLNVNVEMRPDLVLHGLRVWVESASH